MQIADFFDDVVLIAGDAAAEHSCQKRLHRLGISPCAIDLRSTKDLHARLQATLERAQQTGSAGVLILLADQINEAGLWMSQDALVEELTWRPWDVVYIGHGERQAPSGDDCRPCLIHCDRPPSDVCAVVIRCEVLSYLLQVMPERGASGPLCGEDWMSILSWLAIARTQPGHSFAVWPPLLQSAATLGRGDASSRTTQSALH